MKTIFKTSLLKKISQIPGIISYSGLDFASDQTGKPFASKTQTISLAENSRGSIVTIAVVVGYELQVEMVAKEITSVIKAFFEKEKLSVSKINIYFRGVKNEKY